MKEGNSFGIPVAGQNRSVQPIGNQSPIYEFCVFQWPDGTWPSAIEVGGVPRRYELTGDCRPRLGHVSAAGDTHEYGYVYAKLCD